MTVITAVGRCNWCSREQPSGDLLHLSSGQAMCLRCHEWHGHALQVLSGAIPRGCQECGLSTDQLAALTSGPATRMFVVPKDGIYQLLCATCKDRYCRKRSDLYRATQFGQEMKL